ncbi:GntR family transcriptional regulator [Nocardia terpenica]|uniref:GntR family transcriptional regulator n=1 Tax=Nocardia terpenica TaxID=455432 RepID=A0A164MMV4_9NOCA|nr:GntR family transcriptional regulator [Nocardia terpenica]KZM73503.1 GntR family transcriptional regulator [Nocardia terpenica]NQE87307.1 GntR family transcriptional regulator [Nocardia terpenica]
MGNVTGTAPGSTQSQPRYYGTKLALRELIGTMQPSAALPPERVLAERLGTSRTTLRKALAELAAEGLLRRVQGSGTFVAPPKIVHLQQLTSLTDDITAQGLDIGSRVLALTRVPADDTVADQLDITPRRRVHRLERLRMVGGEPLALEVAYLADPLPGLARRLADNGSLYATLRDCYGIEIAAVEDTVETTLTTPEEASLLDVAVGSPMLLVHRRARDPHGRPIEWTRSVYRGDRFRFVAHA